MQKGKKYSQKGCVKSLFWGSAGSERYIDPYLKLKHHDLSQKNTFGNGAGL
jgi:hypothetical protein